MRIGIWCDYGFTLEPSEGIGVFVDNLTRGLVKANANLEVLLMPHPGQEQVLDSTLAAGQGRVSLAHRQPHSRLRRRAIRNLKKLQHLAANRSRPLADLLAGWAARLDKQQQVATQRWIESCDLWLLPYVGTDQQFSGPTVVVLHDLVCYHFPNVIRASQLERFKRQVEQQVAAAGRVACMSDFIREHDLMGTLQLPAERVKVIHSAVPDDLSRRTPAAGAAPVELPPAVPAEQPFLLYPAAFRTYKNHKLLVELIPLLKQSRLWPMKVVFTGIRRCPSWLQSEIAAHQAEEHVILLGKVSREQLAEMYRRAFATVVPSFYEQGSFPAMEGLSRQSPTLVADIPSLREQFASMREDMLYFDPHSPQALLKQVERVADDRERLIQRQQTAFARMRQRTWADAAKEWEVLFEEVIGEHDDASARSQRAA